MRKPNKPVMGKSIMGPLDITKPDPSWFYRFLPKAVVQQFINKEIVLGKFVVGSPVKISESEDTPLMWWWMSNNQSVTEVIVQEDDFRVCRLDFIINGTVAAYAYID